MVQHEFSWGQMVWIEGQDPDLGFSFARMTLNGQSQSDLHYHRNCREMIFIETGHIILKAGNAEFQLQTGDKWVIEPDVHHRLCNVGDGKAVVSIVYSSHNRDYYQVA